MTSVDELVPKDHLLRKIDEVIDFDFIYDAVAVDSGYKTPYICKLLLDDGVRPVMPYKRPQTKKGFFRKYEFIS